MPAAPSSPAEAAVHGGVGGGSGWEAVAGGPAISVSLPAAVAGLMAGAAQGSEAMAQAG